MPEYGRRAARRPLFAPRRCRRAGLVLDVEALSELVAQLLRNDARRNVGDAAGGNGTTMRTALFG